MAQLRYLKGVTTLELDAAKCVGCGICVDVCPHDVFELADKKARIIDKDACMECGACAGNCPAEAITVRSGVGCAAGVINGFLRGTEACCGGDEQEKGCG